jgi:hypothetical protein
LSGNITFGHYSHISNSIFFDSKASDVKQVLENLPSTIGTVDVARTSFLPSQEKVEWVITFGFSQGGNVSPLTVDTSGLSGTGIDVNVTVVKPGNVKVGGSFKLQLYSDANTVTSSIAHNEDAIDLQNKIIQALNLNVTVTRSPEDVGTGAVTWSISYVENFVYSSPDPYIKVHARDKCIS